MYNQSLLVNLFRILFNSDINGINVTMMNEMFQGASSFNQPKNWNKSVMLWLVYFIEHQHLIKI